MKRASTSQDEQSASGVIRIIDRYRSKSKLNEIIYIGIHFRSTRSSVRIADWPAEILKHEPITENFQKFSITRADWFGSGKLFVVPTRTFGNTKIEIFLHEHHLLGTGFEVEVFHRIDKTTMTFNNSEFVALSFGGTINMTMNWQLIKQEDEPLIVFNPNEQLTEYNDPQAKKSRDQ